MPTLAIEIISPKQMMTCYQSSKPILRWASNRKEKNRRLNYATIKSVESWSSLRFIQTTF